MPVPALSYCRRPCHGLKSFIQNISFSLPAKAASSSRKPEKQSLTSGIAVGVVLTDFYLRSWRQFLSALCTGGNMWLEIPSCCLCRGDVSAVGVQHAVCVYALDPAHAGAHQGQALPLQRPHHDGRVLPLPQPPRRRCAFPLEDIASRCTGTGITVFLH